MNVSKLLEITIQEEFTSYFSFCYTTRFLSEKNLATSSSAFFSHTDLTPLLPPPLLPSHTSLEMTIDSVPPITSPILLQCCGRHPALFWCQSSISICLKRLQACHLHIPYHRSREGVGLGLPQTSSTVSIFGSPTTLKL